MNTAIKFYLCPESSAGDARQTVKRSVFVYDEELRRQLRVIERAVKGVYEKSGEWIREVEVYADAKKQVKCVVVDEREELKEMFELLVRD